MKRRAAVKRVAHLVAAAAVAPLAACAPEAHDTASPPAPDQIPVTQFDAADRVVIILAGEPIEVSRANEGYIARSLICPHFGCRLAWREDVGRYLCPCHMGSFDRNGHVLGGPATHGMREVPVRVAGGTIVVGVRGR